MRTIELNSRNWKVVDDFYSALLAALGAPQGHGHNVNAIIDSMVWGGMNTVTPPYTIRISGIEGLSKDVRDEIDMAVRAIADGRRDFQRLRGDDVAIEFELGH